MEDFPVQHAVLLTLSEEKTHTGHTMSWTCSLSAIETRPPLWNNYKTYATNREW